MVNHVRNLLFNESGEFLPVGDTLDEYIPADYTKKKLDGYLNSVYNVLFPEDDRDLRLQRVMVYLKLLHRSYEADVLAYDPRITYDFEPSYDIEHIDLIKTINGLSELGAAITPLFSGLDVEKEYFDTGVGIDRLCAVLLAYVNKLND